jgi:hypothetical protein
MREKSQLDDMRAAVRGDIERARARREADPWRTPEAEQRTEPEPETDNVEPTVPEEQIPVASVPDEPIEEPEAVEEAEAVEVAEPAVLQRPQPTTEPAAPAKTFWSRLFRRA